MANLTDLQETLAISFTDMALLKQALAHSSFINENPGLLLPSNERLEFLGDAVLGFLIAEKLYHDLPGFNEGQMSRLRAFMVSRKTLAVIAESIKLGDYLYLGKGEEASGGRQKPTNLASALEALIAAVFLDQGIETARALVLRLLAPELDRLLKQGEVDYKTELQELVQSRKHVSPTYHIIEQMGPDHDKTFTVEVRIDLSVLGRGTGKTKKEAESEAARIALEKFAGDFTA